MSNTTEVNACSIRHEVYITFCGALFYIVLSFYCTVWLFTHNLHRILQTHHTPQTSRFSCRARRSKVLTSVDRQPHLNDLSSFLIGNMRRSKLKIDVRTLWPELNGRSIAAHIYMHVFQYSRYVGISLNILLKFVLSRVQLPIGRHYLGNDLVPQKAISHHFNIL